jgi:hypothetical protein
MGVDSDFSIVTALLLQPLHNPNKIFHPVSVRNRIILKYHKIFKITAAFSFPFFAEFQFFDRIRVVPVITLCFQQDEVF